MAVLTVVDVSRAGIDIAGDAVAGGGDSFVNTGAEVVLIKNGSGGSLTVTITTTFTEDGLALADRTVTIADGITKAIGPFQRYVYGASVGLAYSASTSVTAKVLRVTPAGA